MAMEPVVLACEGCGVRIRTSDPAKARKRDCPRCGSPLASAVARATGLAAAPSPFDARPRGRRWKTGALAVLVTIGSLASLAVRDESPGPVAPAGSAPDRIEAVRPSLVPATWPAEARAPGEPAIETSDLDATEEVPDLAVPPSPPSRNLAILDHNGGDLAIPGPPRDARPHPLSIDVPPPPTPPIATAAPPRGKSGGNRRFKVRDPRGRAVVAREYGSIKDRMAALLPDGQICWPDGLVITDEPFVPASMVEMRRLLLDDPDFATFRVHQTPHYLIVYQCGESFARASADLLEKLQEGLTGALKKFGLPVVPTEFPLVAVIFATEDDFRANRRVAPDVQACYEILSNRIFFYEKSRRDQDSPEVSALRKPQTVAHEGTHQILNNVGIQPRLSDWPLWLVEGLAEYCSPPKVTKKGVDWAGLGQINPIHVATIRDLDDPLPHQFQGGPRVGLPARDRQTPLVEHLVTRKDLTPTDYALSWALTHYLATKRVKEFVAYLKLLSRLNFDKQSPEEQLATFREVFGDDLAHMDGKVAKHLKSFKLSDALPHYAVIFEQHVGPSAVRRHFMVSQSPSVIREWLESITVPEGGEPRWRALPHFTQKKALEAAEQWMLQGGR
jgi:hypothetical protein